MHVVWGTTQLGNQYRHRQSSDGHMACRQVRICGQFSRSSFLVLICLGAGALLRALPFNEFAFILFIFRHKNARPAQGSPGARVDVNEG